MSPALLSLLIYTVGVKHRGLNKKETYAVEHMFSLSERSALKYAKSAVGGPNREDMIKHNRTHLTRVYPSMSSFARLSHSANFVPNIFWSMGCQLVALNWQTQDLGYEMNQALFTRNGRSGYVLKPESLRAKDIPKVSMEKTKVHVNLEVTVISAQQLPRFRDAVKDKEALDNDTPVLDPFVSLAVIVPETDDFNVHTGGMLASPSLQSIDSGSPRQSTSHRTTRTWTVRQRTTTIRQNGFNPIWNEKLRFDVALPGGGTASRIPSPKVKPADAQPTHPPLDSVTQGWLDLCFLRFEVRDEGYLSTGSSQPSSPTPATLTKLPSTSSSLDSNDHVPPSDADIKEDRPCLGTYMVSLGGLEQGKSLREKVGVSLRVSTGYHHVPLYDAQLSQHLYSTLFVHTRIGLHPASSPP